MLLSYSNMSESFTCSKDVASEFLGQVVWIWQQPYLFLVGVWRVLPENIQSVINLRLIKYPIYTFEEHKVLPKCF